MSKSFSVRRHLPSVLSREHRQVIVMIPRRKNIAGRHSQLPRDLRQSGAFVVGRMTETGVDVVPHHRQVRNSRTIFLQELLDDIRIRNTVRDQAKRGKVIFVELRTKPLAHPVDQSRHVAPDTFKERGVGLVAGVIPSAARFVAGTFQGIDVPFHHHEEIRFHDEPGAGHSLHDARKVASGIDDPFGAFGLEFRQELLQIQRHGRRLKVGMQRPVEISGNELYRTGHGGHACHEIRGSRPH